MLHFSLSPISIFVGSALGLTQAADVVASEYVQLPAQPQHSVSMFKPSQTNAGKVKSEQLVAPSKNELVLESANVIKHLIIIDAAVPDKSLLYGQRQTGTEIVELHANESGIKQLAALLVDYHDLQSVSIFAHGRSGEVILGNSSINTAVVETNTQFMQAFKGAVASGGDIFFYGCDVGKDTQGEQFLTVFNQATDLDVAASDDLTGNASKGGDWDLEIVKGDVDFANRPFSEHALQDFSDVLAFDSTLTFDNLPTGYANSKSYQISGTSYTIKVKSGAGGGLDLYNFTTGYVYVATNSSTQTYSKIYFTNDEEFNLSSLYVYNSSGTNRAVRLTTDKGGVADSSSLVNRQGTNINTSGSLFTGIKWLKVSYTDNSTLGWLRIDNLAINNLSSAPVNSAPVVDLNGGGAGSDSSVSFTEGNGAVNIASSANVADSDADTITTVTVALTNDQDGVLEGLSVSAAAQNALGGISGASDITLQDMISITGASATVAEVTTFLQAITYNNTSPTPNTTARNVTVVINDGTENSVTRSASISVANVTAASSTAAGFNTSNGTNLSPAITFSNDNETLTISNALHIAGSTADGGGGTDTINVIDGADLTGFASLTGFETLTPYNDGSLTLSETQHESFTTINGTGTNQFTISSANGDQTLTGDADIETYVLGAAMTFTLGSAAQNVTGSSAADTVNINAFAVTGTLNGAAGTDVLQVGAGADLSGATISAFESLTLASGASVTMTEAQHDNFSTFTAPGSETITISSATDGLVGNSAIEMYVLAVANTFTLGAVGQNFTGSTGDDSLNVGSFAATGILAGNTGTDTLSIGSGGSISGATISGFENLAVASGGSASIAASQLALFSGTVSGSGTETLTILGDGNFATVSAIENYTIADDSSNARTVAISSAGHSVTASSASDAITFDIGTLAYTGTITGQSTVADTLSMSNGANISNATISNVANLTLASGASVSMTASQHGSFTGTITAPGSETITITGDGDFTTLTGIESYDVADDSTNTRTITVSTGTTNVTADSSTDAITFAIGSSAYTGTLIGENSVADQVQVTDGADISGGGFLNIGTLSLASGATVAIDAANISNFSTAIMGSAGTETLKLMDGGAFDFTSTSVSVVEGVAIGTDNNATITLTDNFNANGQAVSVENASGGAITADLTINASAFSSDALTISASNFNGDDTITGGSGADTIRPGGGTDSMTGNAGNDNFVGDVSQLSGDTITDLAVGDSLTITGVTGLSSANVRFNGTSTLEVDTDATDFNISELTLALSNSPAANLAFSVADSGSDTVITFVEPNSAPVFSSLNGGTTFTENGSAIVIDSDVTIADTELDALNGAIGNYNNASLTISRNGGANTQDVFANNSLLGVLIEGNTFTYNSTTVGTVTTNSAGTLVLTFNANATSAIVDSVLQSITYQNSSESPSSAVTLDYVFNDGVANSTGTNQAVVNITGLNDSPTDISLSSASINQSSTGVAANIGSLSTSDVDTSDSHSYSFVSSGASVSGTCSADTNNSSFQISGSLIQTQAALNAGSYIICVQSSDATTTFQKAFTITVTDDVAPNAPSTPDLDVASDSGVSNTDNITSDTTPTFSGTAESGSTVALYSDQVGGGATVIGTATATGGNWQITTSALTSGLDHAISAKATDAASNVSSSSGALTITIDTAAPIAPSSPDLSAASDSGASNTDNITNDTTPTFTGTGTTGDSITLISSIDGSIGSAVVIGGVWSITASSAMSSGSHAIMARATDSAGNITNGTSTTITIDTNVSTPSITTPIEVDGQINAVEDGHVLIQGSGADSGATVNVTISNGANSLSRSVTADGSGAWTISGNEFDVSSFNNSTLTVSATQSDTAGNTSSAASTSVILDNTAPNALTIATPIESDGRVNANEDDSVLITGSGAEANASVSVTISDGANSLSRSVTADGSGAWTISGNEFDVSSFNNGTLTVSATQSDAAGNTSSAASASVVLDNAAPSAVTITTPIEGDDIVNANEDGSVLIAGSGAEAGATVNVNVAGVSRTITADGSGNWSLNGSELDISALNNGILTVSATQTDSAGNTSPAATTSITLDNIAPTGHAASVDQSVINASNESAMSASLSGLEGAGTLSYQVSDGSNSVSGTATISAATLQITGINVTSLAEGTLTFSAIATDTAGNASSAMTAIVTKQYNVAPVLSGTPSTTTAEDAAYSFTPTLTDSDTGDTHTFTIINRPSWANFNTSTGELSGTPDNSDVGSYTNITIGVNDGMASASLAPFTLEVTNTNDAPVGQNFSFNLDEAATLTVALVNGLLSNASDDDTGDTLTAVGVSQPQFGSLTLNSDGSFSYQHDGSENHSDSFTFQVRDSDGALSAVQTVTLTITAVADAPIAVNDSATTDEDTAVNFSLVANDTDAEGDLVAASAAIVLPASKGSVSITNGIATYTPNANETGTDTFTYTVKDAALNTSAAATVTVTITPVNDIPVVQALNINVDEDTPSVATALRSLATDVEDTTPTGDIIIVRGPTSGLVVLDQAAGTFVYTPDANVTGQDSFTYTITDSEGGVSLPATVTVNIGAVNDRPVVVNDAVTTDEDTAVSLAILANDSDVEDSGFNAANVSLENKGTGAGMYDFANVSVNLDGSLAITPKQDVNGEFSFTYTLTDSEGLSSTPATVTLTINAINDAPVAMDNTAQLQEEGSFEVNVLGNDSDVDTGDSLDVSSVSIVTDATNGQTQVTATGAIIYTANADYFGSDSFTYTVKDSNGATSNVASVTMTVNPVNDAPTGQAQTLSLDEDASLLITLLASDIENDSLTYRIDSDVSQGTLVQQSADGWLYTPTANFNGSDSFSFIANDGALDSAPVSVNLTVNAINDAPVASTDTVSVNEDSSITINLAASDIEGDTLNYQISRQPQNGTVTLTGSQAVYQGDSHFFGTDFFSFIVNDGTVDSAPADITVNVTSVNDVPVISGAPSLSISEKTAYSFTPTAVDTEGDSLTFSITNKPSWLSFDSSTGTLSGTATNADVGVHNNIVLSVSDGMDTVSLPTFNLTVINVNDAPTIGGVPALNVDQDAPYSFTPTANDIDGDSLTFSISNKPSWASFDSSTGQLSGTPSNDDVGVNNNIIISVSDGAITTALSSFNLTVNNINDAPTISGTPSTTVSEDSPYQFTPSARDIDSDSLSFNISNKPSWASFNTSTGELSGTPDNSDVGSYANITISVSDGTASASLAPFTLEVTNTNDAPVGQNFSFNLDEGATLTVALANGLLSNASDDDTGDTLTAVGVSQPLFGSLTLNSDGSFSYQHDGSENHSDSFTFQVRDSDGALSAVQTVTLTIAAVADAPIAVNDSATTDEDTAVNFSLVDNDTDAEGDLVAASAAIVLPASKGSVSITNGIATYTPNANETGVDTFTYTVKDAALNTSAAATATVTITPVNDMPVVQALNINVDEDTPSVATALRSLATDVEDTTPTGDITLVSSPTSGQVVLDQAAGTFVYTPDANVTGQDSFTYTITDSEGGVSLPATVTVNIGAVNDRPVVVNDAVTTDEDTAVSLAILANDSDVEDSGFNAANVSLENKGTGAGMYDFANVSVNLDGSLAITPKQDVNGEFSFTYTLTDSEGLSSTPATVTLTINAINDAPVAMDNTAQLQEEGSFEVNVLGNDSDVDTGDSLDVSSVSIVTDATNGQTQVTATGAIIYTANADYFGSDSFTYTVKDSNGATSNVASVTMTVNPVNDAPTGQAQTLSLDEDASLLITLLASDIENDSLTYRIDSDVSQGTLVQQSADGWLYTPTANFNGSDSFSFIANDGALDSAPVSVNLTVNAINDAPVASTDTVSVNEDSSITINLAASDIEGDTLNYQISRQPQNGTVTLTGSQAVYQGDSHFFGTDFFSFIVNDGTVDSAPADITVNVTSVNDVPVISGAPSLSISEKTAYSFTPTAVDTEGDSLTFSITNKPSWLSFDSSTGTLSGTATNADVGVHNNIVLSVSDGMDTVSLPTFNLTVINVNDAPTIGGVPALNVDQDAPYSFTPTANDIDGDSLTFSISNKPSWASFDSSTGQLSGTPSNDDVGVNNNIIISVSDGAITTALSSFNLTVNNINDAPTISGTPSTTVSEDSPYQFTPSARDIDSDSLSFNISNKPSWASFNTSTGELSGTPDNSDVGSYANITISVSDGTASASLAPFTLEVTNTNDAPVGQNFSFNLDEGATLTVALANGLLSNASDDDTGDTLTAVGVSQPQFGSLTLSGDGSFSYQHDGSENHSDSFTFQVRDSDGALSAVYTVTLTIAAVADAPVANDDSATTDEDTAVNFSLVANDLDAEDDLVAASAAIVLPASKGSVSITNGIATYTPNANEIGVDTFTYTVKDAALNTSAAATVTVTITPVNDMPVVQSVNINVDEDTPSTATALRSLATDVEDSTPTGDITLVSSPTSGLVVLDQAAGTFVYTPDANVTGQDSFTYTLTDSEGGVSLPGTVTVNIGAVNDRPVVVNDAVTTDEDTAVSLAILANDSDVEDSGFNAANVSLENKGTGAGMYDFADVSVNLDGSLAIMPQQDVNGEFSFTYTLTDSEGLSSTPATVTLTINAVNDAPVAMDNTAQLQEEGSFEVNVLGNDSDVDSGDGLDVSSVSIVTDADNGQTQITVTGAIIYTANADYFGNDSFTYTVKDSNGATSNVATVTMTVNPVNDAPIGIAQELVLAEDEALLITLVGSDIENDDLSYRIDEGALHGSLVQQSNDSWLYTPNANYNGSDGLSFVVNDGQLDSASTAISLVITAVNDAPTVSAQSANVDEDTAVVINLLGNDIEGDTLTYLVVEQPAHGTATISGEQVTYQGHANYFGEDQFTYIANDGLLDSVANTVSVTVNSVNDLPIISGTPSLTIDENALYRFIPTATDNDGDSLSFSIENQPNWLAFDTTTGQLSGTPSNADVGLYSDITLSVTDGITTQSLAPFTLSVVNINDAPMISGEPLTSIAQDKSYSFTPTVSDIDSTALSFSITNKPHWATFDSTSGTLSGVPTRENVGVHSNILISVTDGQLSSTLNPFSIDVTYVNVSPIANDMQLNIEEDTAISVSAKISDSDEDSLAIQLVTEPQFGSLTVQGRVFSYQPEENYHGSDSFSYSVFDGKDNSPIATVAINVASVNDEPQALADTFNLTPTQSGQYTLDVLANDIDVDGDKLNIIGAKASVGTVSIVDDQLLFELAASTLSSINIEYMITDPHNANSHANATLSFNEKMDGAPTIAAPVDVSINATGLFTRVKLGTATAFDAQGNPLPVSTVEPNMLFAPGAHQVYWQTMDSAGNMALAEQQVLVHPQVSLDKGKKVAEQQSYTTFVYLNGEAPSYPITIPYTISGTATEDDHDLTSGEVVIEQGLVGEISFNVFADSEVEADEVLTITLDESLNTGVNASSVITITEQNIAPTLSTTIEQNNQTRPFVLANDDLVTVRAFATDNNPTDTISISWQVDDERIINLADHSDTFVFSTADLTEGIYDIAVTATDNAQQSLSSTVTRYVEVVAQLPELTNTDTDKDLLPDVLEGYQDSDNDGIADYLDPISMCYVMPEQVTQTTQFLVEGDIDGCLRKAYSGLENSSGALQFLSSELPADEGMLNISGYFGFIVTDIEPVGSRYNIVLPQRMPIPANAVYRKLMSNEWRDFDTTEGDQVYSTQGERGYCPSPSSELWQEGLQEGDWCVRLRIADGGLNDVDASVNGQIVDPGGVAVMKTDNNNPITQSDQAVIAVGSTIIFDVLNNDSDEDTNVLKLTGANVDFGEVTIIDNQLSYTPLSNFIGTATIRYSVSDGQGGTAFDVATVNVVVNSAPTTAADNASTNDRTQIVIDVLSNDSDVDGDTLTLTSAVANEGEVAVNSDGTLSYQPKQGFEGVDLIEYTVTDSKGASSQGEVKVTVKAYTTTAVNNSSSGSMGGMLVIMLLGGVLIRRTTKVIPWALLATVSIASQPAVAGTWSLDGQIGYGAVAGTPSVMSESVFANTAYDDTDVSWSIAGNYTLASNWQFGLRYINLGEGSTTFVGDTLDPTNTHLSLSNKVPVLGQGPALQTAYVFPLFGQVKSKLFIGAFYYHYSIESLNNSGQKVEYNESNTRPYFGGQLAYPILKNTDVSLNFSHYTLNENDVNEWALGFEYKF